MALVTLVSQGAKKNTYRCDCCSFVGEWSSARWRVAPAKTKHSLDGLEHYCSNDCVKKARPDAVNSTDEAFQEHINQGISRLPVVKESRGLM